MATKPARVGEVAAGLPDSAWRRVTVADGSRGPLVHEYTAVAVWLSEQRLPSGPVRPSIRRPVGQEPGVRHHRTNAPAEVPPAAVAAIRSERWSIGPDFRNAKGECGLDEYETRGGWAGTTTPPSRSRPCGPRPGSGTGPGEARPA